MKEKVIGFIKKRYGIMRSNDTCNGIRFFCKTNIELCKLY